MRNLQLRPLSLGEIADGAVTLCVRHFLHLSLIYVVFIVPVTLFQFYGTEEQAQLLSALIELTRSNPERPIDPRVLSKIFEQYPVFNGFLLAWMGSMLLVWPLALAAFIVAISRAYLGAGITFQRAYREALRSWLRLVAVHILSIVTVAGFFAVIIVAFFVLILTFMGLEMVNHALAIAVGIVVGLIAVVMCVAAGLLALLVVYISYFTCVVEGTTVVTAFMCSFRRVFSPVMIRHSLAVAGAIGAIFCGLGLIRIMGNALFYGILRSSIADVAFTVVLYVIAGMFVTTFFCMCYYDVRIRREGYDLHYEINASLPPI